LASPLSYNLEGFENLQGFFLVQHRLSQRRLNKGITNCFDLAGKARMAGIFIELSIER
jgi:hypothetical protein